MVIKSFNTYFYYSKENGKSRCFYIMRGQSLYDYCMEHEDKKYLLEEWDYEKNESDLGISPKDITYGSNKRVWWVCNICTNIYEMPIVNRTYRNSGCSKCAIKRVHDSQSKNAALYGNDLASGNSKLLQEWSFERNNILPNEVAAFSNRRVWWKCITCGYEWEAIIANRSRGQNCPQCAKEVSSSFPEQVIYYYLKAVYKDVISGSRDLLGNNSELDIYIPEVQTAIEYDGVAWHKDIDKDLKKNKLCQEKGIRLIRIREEGLPDVEGSINIFRGNRHLDSDLENVLKKLLSLLGIEVDINIERDKQLIYSQYIQSKKENSLALKFPEIAKEWHPIKNGSLTPDNVSYGSAKKVWWLCEKGHEYISIVYSRAIQNTGCPYCANKKVLIGFNDLCTTHPILVKEWNYTRNCDLKPENVTCGSDKKVWWLCEKGHEYCNSINKRTIRGQGCPYCANKEVLIGFNDLESLYPDIAKCWDYRKNGSLTPNKVVYGSGKKVWWFCEKGHEYEMPINIKVSRNVGCPYCGGKKVLKGFNDLETNYPDLLVDWDYDKNDVLPSEISKGSHKEIHWKCSVCGYEYVRVAREQVKIKGIHCPECAKKNRNK